MNYGFVYLTTNNLTGKKYIGQHKRRQDPSDPDDSWYLGSGNLLIKALEKYGLENFSRIILCECNNQEDLNAKEEYYIKEYNAVKDPTFYNISSDAYHSNLKGEDHWIYKKQGGKLSSSHKENLRKASNIRWSNEDARREMSAKISPTLIGNKRREGTTQSEGTRRKISEANKGNKPSDLCREINSKLRSETNAIKFTGTVWITNDVSNRRIRQGDPIPEGWRLGKLHKKK